MSAPMQALVGFAGVVLAIYGAAWALALPDATGPRCLVCGDVSWWDAHWEQYRCACERDGAA